MRLFYMMLMILSINVGAGVVSYVFDYQGAELHYDSNLISDTQTKYSNLEYSDQMENDYLYKNVDPQDAKRGLSLLELVKRSIFFHVLLSRMFGIDWAMALLLSAPMYLFYIIALIQLFRGISAEGST